jgi:hypothetical protein
MVIYPVSGKKKSANLCSAFLEGSPNAEDAAVFFGVDHSNQEHWQRVRKGGQPFYYIDNSYFDSTRQTYFRITKNRLQHPGTGTSSGVRFGRLGVKIQPWKTAGKHLVVCPQSDYFMRVVVGYRGNWLDDISAQLKFVTPMPVKVRSWSSDKTALAATLESDLDGAHALLTWSSAAAVTAILNGVPAISFGESAAAAVGSTSLRALAAPPKPERGVWCGVLADNQFTVEEMRSGKAWEMLQ